ncbi:hypothetical protein Q669_01110 [Labrenzia sp. C1B10]|nr:hypothetical protein Q669_01110 [Labrenzia sp. C1B10]ERS00841.1 hypothetical protein Q675_08535 [Labrenzia sp. C1B70]
MVHDRVQAIIGDGRVGPLQARQQERLVRPLLGTAGIFARLRIDGFETLDEDRLLYTEVCRDPVGWAVRVVIGNGGTSQEQCGKEKGGAHLTISLKRNRLPVFGDGFPDHATTLPASIFQDVIIVTNFPKAPFFSITVIDRADKTSD